MKMETTKTLIDAMVEFISDNDMIEEIANTLYFDWNITSNDFGELDLNSWAYHRTLDALACLEEEGEEKCIVCELRCCDVRDIKENPERVGIEALSMKLL